MITSIVSTQTSNILHQQHSRPGSNVLRYDTATATSPGERKSGSTIGGRDPCHTCGVH